MCDRTLPSLLVLRNVVFQLYISSAQYCTPPPTNCRNELWVTTLATLCATAHCRASLFHETLYSSCISRRPSTVSPPHELSQRTVGNNTRNIMCDRTLPSLLVLRNVVFQLYIVGPVLYPPPTNCRNELWVTTLATLCATAHCRASLFYETLYSNCISSAQYCIYFR